MIFGITGRMGRALVDVLRSEDARLQLSGAVAAVNSARLGEDAAAHGSPLRIAITARPEEALRDADVAVIFSPADTAAAYVHACATAGVACLIGSTGFADAERAAFDRAAARIAVLVAPNLSLGAAVLARLAQTAARELDTSYDVEIAEAHHRHKKDAPSGTALALGASVARARRASLGDVAVFERSGSLGARTPGSIGFSAVRAGDIVGEHTVMFATAGERLELTHRVTDRTVFARGALRAAHWLIGRPAGLYGMEDVLIGEGMDSLPASG